MVGFPLLTVECGDQTKFTRLGSKHVYPLKDFVGPCLVVFTGQCDGSPLALPADPQAQVLISRTAK